MKEVGKSYKIHLPDSIAKRDFYLDALRNCLEEEGYGLFQGSVIYGGLGGIISRRRGEGESMIPSAIIFTDIVATFVKDPKLEKILQDFTPNI